MTHEKIIYDFGANNGDDIPYYLLKADLVVAVEANPALTDIIKTKFATEIKQGRLVVENCALTIDPSRSSIPFYVCENNVQSQMIRPDDHDMGRFTEISIQSKNVIELINKYGNPHYIKIDIEHYDQFVLKEIFLNKIFPPYISCEAHIPDIFCIMVAMGNYKTFKYTIGREVHNDYKNTQVITLSGETQIYTFPHHAAGPFGDDLKGRWHNTSDMFKELSDKFGWIDIHATNTRET